MYFQGNDKSNDDWLISPGFTLDGSKIYELSYYYRTSTSNENKFEVLLSNNGRQTSEFKKVLVKSAVYKNSVYQKETVYITNYTGDVFIAWHVIGDGTNLLRIDNVSVEEVSCIAPHNLTITGVTKNTVDFSFEDDNNTSWEYHIQPGGIGTPIGSGRLTKKKENSDNQTSGTSSSKLQPNTEYEIYVRSQCGKDANSKWIGPIIFTTACNEEALPFWEGFNSSSDVSCWRILDNDLDGKQWGASSSVVFEGNRAFSFDVYGTGADDYLITPGFNFDASKTYKLQFHYRTSPNYKTDFEVLLSNSGTNVNNFNKKLLTKVGESSVSWKEEKIIVGGISGIVNFAWHVNGKSTNYLYLDNVFVEEVSCPDPTQLDVINIKDKQVDLKWEDDYGKN